MNNYFTKGKLYLASTLLAISFSPTIKAHNVKTSEDVGVTFHIEPDHSPRAGDSNQAWFALTRQGGSLIPLQECLCQLEVYLSGDETPVLTPELTPISPEQYQNIPGANIVFPQAGIYQLQLTGQPANPGDFAPFEVSYPVTVKPGVITPNAAVDDSSSEDSQVDSETNTASSEIPQRKTPSYTPWLLGVLGASLLGALLFGVVDRK